MDREEAFRLLASEKSLFADVLPFDLSKRSDLIIKHKKEVAYICRLLDNYIEDVHRIIDGNLPYSMISHLTYNLIHNLASCLVGLTIYDFLNTSYLLSDNYDDNYKMWEKFSEAAKKIRVVIKKLNELNIYHKDANSGVGNLIPPKNNEKYAVYSLLNLEDELSLINGDGLFNALLYYLEALENKLVTIKTGINNLTDDDFERIYNANYALYVETYWRIEGKNFRHHIESHYFRRRESEIDTLIRLLSDEQYNFEKDGIGEFWRDYSHDKKMLYFEMKRAEVDEEQWRYFFKNICRFEEYEKWIDELEHPNAEVKEYPVSDWDKIFKGAIDVAKVKIIIPDLLPEKISKPHVFVLHKVLEEIDWLQDNADTHFIKWFCEIYGWSSSSNDFKSIDSRLKEHHTLDWDIKTLTSEKISKDYMNLADNIRKEFVDKLDGHTVIQDNKNYYLKPDSYIEHKIKL